MSLSSLVANDIVIEFNVVKEERPSYKNNITNYPIESGESISDHVVSTPMSLSITGVITNTSFELSKKQMMRWMLDAEVLTYHGNKTYPNLVILDFTEMNSSEMGDGFMFSVSMQEVIITRPATVEIVTGDPAKRSPVSPSDISENEMVAVSTQASGVGDRGVIQTIPISDMRLVNVGNNMVLPAVSYNLGRYYDKEVEYGVYTH